MKNEKRLYLSDNDKKICGVCGGIAEYFSFDSTLVRLIYALFTICSIGIGILLYFVASVLIPERPLKK